MYAVIETGSKQYRVEVGTELEVELLDVEAGQTISLDRVLLVADGDTAAVGRPVVDGARVSVEVLRRDRGEKLIVFKYRPKARRRVKKGHRQELTVLRVADIVFQGKSAAEDVRKAEEAARTERQRLEDAAARQAAEDAALAAKLAKAAAKEEAAAAPAKTGAAKRSTKTDTTEARSATTDSKSSADAPKRARAKPGGAVRRDSATPKRSPRTEKDE
jgi:large subunit ribosomal protein L21